MHMRILVMLLLDLWSTSHILLLYFIFVWEGVRFLYCCCSNFYLPQIHAAPEYKDPRIDTDQALSCWIDGECRSDGLCHLLFVHSIYRFRSYPNFPSSHIFQAGRVSRQRMVALFRNGTYPEPPHMSHLISGVVDNKYCTHYQPILRHSRQLAKWNRLTALFQ